MRFADRTEAGRELATRLPAVDAGTAVVLALPRGGVPVATEVARVLEAPLDVIGVRKLGAPQQPELGIGAIAEGGVRVVDNDAVRVLGLDDDALRPIEEAEREELERRVAAYRGDRSFPDLSGRTVIVVDDGLATGSSMRAALQAVRALRPARVVAAVPALRLISIGLPSSVAVGFVVALHVLGLLVPRPPAPGRRSDTVPRAVPLTPRTGSYARNGPCAFYGSGL
jgi:putative phosphoribosyl transferase